MHVSDGFDKLSDSLAKEVCEHKAFRDALETRCWKTSNANVQLKRDELKELQKLIRDKVMESAKDDLPVDEFAAGQFDSDFFVGKISRFGFGIKGSRSEGKSVNLNSIGKIQTDLIDELRTKSNEKFAAGKEICENRAYRDAVETRCWKTRGIDNVMLSADERKSLVDLLNRKLEVYKSANLPAELFGDGSIDSDFFVGKIDRFSVLVEANQDGTVVPLSSVTKLQNSFKERFGQSFASPEALAGREICEHKAFRDAVETRCWKSREGMNLVSLSSQEVKELESIIAAKLQINEVAGELSADVFVGKVGSQ